MLFRVLLAAVVAAAISFAGAASAQVDYQLDNQPGASFRAELNNIIGALVQNAYSATAPTTTFAGQWWVDSSGADPVLKMRNAADSAWITLGVVASGGFQPQGTTAYSRTILDDTTAAAARTTLGLGALSVLAQVGTAQIADGSVTEAKLAGGAFSPLDGPAIAAGSTPVWRDTTEYNQDGGAAAQTIFTWHMVQDGTITVAAELRKNDESCPDLEIFINDVEQDELVAAGVSYAEDTATITVARGDVLRMTFNLDGGNANDTWLRNLEVRTDGSVLWPDVDRNDNVGSFLAANFD